MDELYFKKAEKKDAAILAEYRFRMFDDIFQEDNLSERKAEIVGRCTRYYLDEIGNKNHYSIIAFIDKKAVGCGTILLEDRPPNPRHRINLHAYILNIYVDAEHRGKGIAKKIMEHLHEYARSKDVRRIGLHASRFGHGLYRKMGYKINESYLEIEL
ncbi:MAG: GNAT family N-acetyltransferase [Actinomycetota bacterium]|nr:GNAT family N-acetyltransferase [Actinomycetota bacterium]